MGRPAREQGPGKGRPALWSLALSSFHPVQRGRPPGLQACLQGQALGVQRKGVVGDFDPYSHWGTQPPAAWTLTPAFGPPRDGHMEAVRVLVEVPRGWGSTRAEPSGRRCLEGVGSARRGGQCTQGWAVDVGVRVLGGNSPRPMVTAGTEADRSSSGLSRAGGWGEGRGTDGP